jgi:uncharacterized repeat protein (TIGR01451 family)
VEPGATVRATLSFKNLGGGIAKGIRVRFSLPEGLTYLVDSARIDNAPLDSLAGAGSLVSSGGAELPEVEPGAERRISLAYLVAPTLENATGIAVQAAIASYDLPLVGSNIARLIVRSRPQLQGEETRLSIATPREVLPGCELTVSARVHNAGESSANDVIVALPVPVGTSFVEGSAQVDGTSVDDRKQRDPLGFQHPLIAARKLGPGATATIGYRVRVDSPLQDGSRIEAHGSVASRETSEFQLAAASVTVASRASFEGERTALEVTQYGGTPLSEEVAPGQPIAICLSAFNSGTNAAHETVLSVALAAGLEAVPASVRRDGQPAGSESGEAVTLNAGSIDAGAAVTLQFMAIVASPAPHGRTLPIAAKVLWNGGSRSFDKVLAVASAPRFSPNRNRITRETPSVVAPGDRVEYTVTIVNDGTATAHDAMLRLGVDDGLDDVDLVEGGNAQRLYGEAIPLGAIDPHVPRTLKVTGRVRVPLANGSEIGCRATVSSPGAKALELREARTTVRSRARFSAATSVLRRHAEDVLRPDQTLAVTIAVKNEGDETARDALVTLNVTPELRLESVDGARRDGSTLTLGEVAAGAGREATAHFRLLPFVSRDTVLTVDAVLSGPTILPVALETLSFASHAEPRLADGASLLTTPRDSVDAGAEVGFTLVLRNSGDGAAARIAIRGAQPINTVYVPSSTSVNGVALQDHGGTSLLWSREGLILSDVAPGAEIVVRWMSIVNTPLPPGTIIIARIEVAADELTPFDVESNGPAVRSAPAFAIPSISLPFSISGAAAHRSFGFEQSFAELPMRRVTPLPPGSERAYLAGLSEAAVDLNNATHWGEAAIDQASQHLVLDLSAERISGIVNYFDQTNFSSLISHLFVLHALFPERVFAGGDAQPALEAELAQLREIFNKLFVKLRLPRFKPGERDLESEGSRASARAIFAALAEAPALAVVAPQPETTRLIGTIVRDQCRRLAIALEAPHTGDAAPWLGLAHLLGERLDRGGSEFGSLARYRSELVSTLEGFAGRPAALFVNALTCERSAELDAALGALLDDLRACVAEPR